MVHATDSKFTFNSANSDGGAIEISHETADLLRCTFDHNTAVTGFGGALDSGNMLATVAGLEGIDARSPAIESDLEDAFEAETASVWSERLQAAGIGAA